MDSASAYIYGTSGTPTEQVSVDTGAIRYLVSDMLGSVRGIVNSSGSLAVPPAASQLPHPMGVTLMESGEPDLGRYRNSLLLLLGPLELNNVPKIGFDGWGRSSGP